MTENNFGNGAFVEPRFVQITRRLRQIAHAISKHSKFLQETYKLTLPQIMCLLEVHRRGSVAIGALTKTVALNNSTVTGIIDRLERDQLVRRVRTSSDRRQIHIEITDHGKEVLTKLPPPLDSGFMQRFRELSVAEQDRIVGSLDTLAQMLNPSGIVDPSLVTEGIYADVEDEPSKS